MIPYGKPSRAQEQARKALQDAWTAYKAALDGLEIVKEKPAPKIKARAKKGAQIIEFDGGTRHVTVTNGHTKSTVVYTAAYKPSRPNKRHPVVAPGEERESWATKE